jgi:osmoprotectant transport system ATP-binding protein
MIRLDGVSKKYDDGTVAVHDLDLAVPEGETVVLVGPSGCGKSTTLKMVNRLIEPTGGRILFGGEDVTHADPVKLRRRMGYVIQQTGLFPHQTIAANVATVPKLLGWDRKKVDARVHELLELVGLDPKTYAKRYPHQLSGGQRQRVGVARALAADPPVLLMDEPFGAVDPITRGNLQDELLRLQSELGKTIVFVTHDFDEAVKLGDKIAVLGDRSTIQQYDTPDAILANPANDTVAGFVGAGASLKQLTLLRVRDVPFDTESVIAVDHGDAPAQVAEKLRLADRSYALVLDERQRPLRWVHRRELAGRTSLLEAGKPVGDSVTTQSTLQDALEAILTEGGHAVVTGSRGELVGTIDISTVTDVIANVRETHADGGSA